MSGAADELILSDKSLRPLAARPGDAPPAVELEVERPKQVGLPPEDGGEAESIEPSSLPDEITAVWWRKHRSCLEYSEKRNAWVFEALRDLYPGDAKEKPRAEKEKKDVVSKRALESQGIDAAGLSRVDRKILEVLVSRSRPLGLRSLADLIGENPRTIAEIYEPYLLREGYLLRTHRGRTATAKAAELFKRHLSSARKARAM